ncbi:MAG TPA: hypothetical protein VGD08_25285 [Stellaceae bacterium]
MKVASQADRVAGSPAVSEIQEHYQDQVFDSKRFIIVRNRNFDLFFSCLFFCFRPVINLLMKPGRSHGDGGNGSAAAPGEAGKIIFRFSVSKSGHAPPERHCRYRIRLDHMTLLDLCATDPDRLAVRRAPIRYRCDDRHRHPAWPWAGIQPTMRAL